jgi:surface antigen
VSNRDETDPLGFLFGGQRTTADGAPELPVVARSVDTPAAPSAIPATAVPMAEAPLHPAARPSTGATPVYPTRRSLREAATASAAAPVSAVEPVETAVAHESALPPVPPSSTAPLDAPSFAAHAAEPVLLTAPPAKPKRTSRARRQRSPEAQALTAFHRRQIRQRASAAGTMLVVGGLFASLALPAYAESGNAETAALAARSSAAGATQTLEVSDTVSPESTKRDKYGTTSAAELEKLYQDALRQKNLEDYLQSDAKDLGDDYPWYAELSDDQGGGLSPLNYYYRECVDFVAWRLNRDAGSKKAPYRYTWSTLGAGDASSWKSAWERKNWKVSDKPKAGAVAWFSSGNHISYVTGVLDNGDVLLEEYNYANDHRYNQRVIKADEAEYLYAPD